MLHFPILLYYDMLVGFCCIPSNKLMILKRHCIILQIDDGNVQVVVLGVADKFLWCRSYVVYDSY